jgi:glycosyltransferase involved in cell wall biosynthesis
MHLVFIIDNPPIIGGGDYALYKYAEGMARRGHEVDVFGRVRNEFMDGLERRPNFRVRLRGELPPWFRGVGVLNRAWDRAYTAVRVAPWLRARRVDFVIGYHRDSAIKAARLAEPRHLPVANVVFETPDWIRRTLGARFERTYTGRFRAQWEAAGAAYRASDLLFPLSEIVRREVAAWTEREVAPPLYPGVDAGAVAEPAPGPGRHVIYIGRLDANKNVHEIIEGLARLPERPPLVIAGSGHDEAELRDLAHRRGVACTFEGRVSDRRKWELLRDARFMVFPSSFEGFGIPPAEMLLCGRPCICSDIPILREIYGDHVEYFPEHDVAALTALMARLLADPDHGAQRGRAGRAFVLQTYTWDRAARHLESQLRQWQAAHPERCPS